MEKFILLLITSLINGIISINWADFLNSVQLDLKKRQITSIQGIEKLTNTKILDLSNNLITSIEGIENLTTLEKLYISNNQIVSILPIEKLAILTDLNLSKNGKCFYISKMKYFMNIPNWTC